MQVNLTVPVNRTDNADGAPNFQTPGGFLHSRRNPREEADRLAQAVAEACREHPQSDLILIGIGWGYVVEALHALDPAQHLRLFFIEPIGRVRDELKSCGRLDVLEALRPGRFLESVTKGLNRIWISPNYERLFGAEIRAALSARSDGTAAGSEAVDRKTRQHFFSRWLRNHFRFLKRSEPVFFVPPLPRNPSAVSTAPVLFCGASPSLIRDLQPIQDDIRNGRSLLICADTALAPVLSMGLRPDFVVSVDAGRGTICHFSAALSLGMNPETIPVLTWTGGLPLPRSFPGRLLYFRTTFPFDQLLGEGPLGTVREWKNPSRNSAGIGILAAQSLGRQRLFTAGVSFQPEGDQTHVRGTGYTWYALVRQTRISPVESYRPGGYNTETEKNKVSMDGLLAMAQDFGMEIRPVAGSKDVWDADIATAHRESRESPEGAHEPEPVQIDRDVLRSFLRKVREGIDFETIRRETGSTTTGVNKWKRLFQNL